MDNYTLDVSICIVSYQTRDLLQQCLDSIYIKNKGVSLEILVVDNASTDKTTNMLRDNFPHVNLIANNKNLGFAAASNQAIKRSKGRYILLLNPDTVIVNSSLSMLVEFMDCYPEAGAVGPQIINPDGTPQFSYDDLISLGKFFRELVIDQLLLLCGLSIKRRSKNTLEDWYCPKIKEVGRIRGCSLLVRREAIDRVGLLDERFFMYCEEVDWERRMKKAGWRIYFYPFAYVIHCWGASSRQNKKKIDLIHWQSNFKYFYKHYGFLGVFLVRCMVFINALLETINQLKNLILGVLSKEEFFQRIIEIWKILWLNQNKNLGESYD